MIEFRSERLASRFLSPGSDEETEAVSEVRWDPLLGHTMRVTAPRPFRPPKARSSETPAESLPPEALGQKRCPFCNDLSAVTPGLVPELGVGRHMTRGEATLFPNLYPYGAWSTVICFTEQHHVELDAFTEQQLTDALLLGRDYVRRVGAVDPTSRFVAISWNYMPPSGGTLVHPHLQVNLDPVPTNGLRETRDASMAWRSRHGRSYWDVLVETERQLGLRYLADVGTTAWLLPWAPRAHVETWALVPGVSRISALSDENVADLARGLNTLCRAFGHVGRNSLNMALEAVETDDGEPAVRMRIAARAKYQRFYRSDQTHFDVVLEECATILAPEMSAALLRPAFGAAADPTAERRTA